MKNFSNTCRRYINPWVLGVIIVAIIGLIVFVPVIGVASLVVALPFVGCIVMCDTMGFIMKEKRKGIKYEDE